MSVADSMGLEMTMESQFYAHSCQRKPPCNTKPCEHWQLLKDHLLGVAELARRFAKEAKPDDPAFHEAAYWAGLLHDLGKYKPEFQELLRGLRHKSEVTRHKQIGAAIANMHKRSDICFAIAGHHGGLPDITDLREIVVSVNSGKQIPEVTKRASAENDEYTHSLPQWTGSNDSFEYDLYVRMLFSCLVDADWTDTSTCASPPDINNNKLTALEPSQKLQNVLTYIADRAKTCRDSSIGAIRREILDAALAAAEQNPGLFTMTVPTGGGKTLSTLAFALSHAAHHGMRRIIYVAPYLSIIEQNAREIRRALDDDASNMVFEHHSLAEPEVVDEMDDTQSEDAHRKAENWAMPVIITTNVQFYESLFSNRPSQCRKLHNMAGSVIILDECQTLPPDIVAPTCSMLQQFADFAGCSIVLCTATQPAWDKREHFSEGLSNVRAIVPESIRLFERLRRVRLQWPNTDAPRLDWKEVAHEMLENTSSLCVVNTRKAARAIFAALTQSGCDSALHLSTFMCPAHRLSVIDEVRQRLADGKACHLVSTQLIEAGVDVDFPHVMREMAPLEAIIQAAGRCNREGRLNDVNGNPGGRVLIFRSVDGYEASLRLDRWYAAGIAKVEQDFLGIGHEPDVASPQDMQEYFSRLYRSGELDQHNIQKLRSNRCFKMIAEKYQLIDQATESVVVATYEACRKELEDMLNQLRYHKSRSLFNRIGRYQVNLAGYQLRQASNRIIPDLSGLNVWQGPYDKSLGIVIDGNISLDPV